MYIYTYIYTYTYTYTGVFGEERVLGYVKRLQTQNITLDQYIGLLYKKYSIYIGIILDEVHTLFIPNAPSDHPTVLALYQYHSYARYYVNTLLILISSSTYMPNLLYNSNRNIHIYGNYPNFNGQLMSFFSVTAIRDYNELVLYLKYRYNNDVVCTATAITTITTATTTATTARNSISNMTEAEIEVYAYKVLHYTGGIARNIDIYIKSDTQLYTSTTTTTTTAAAATTQSYTYTCSIQSMDHIIYPTEFRIFLNVLRRYQEEKNKMWLGVILSAATYAGASVETEVTAVGIGGEALAETDTETAKEGAAAAAVGTVKEGVAADIIAREAAALAVAGESATTRATVGMGATAEDEGASADTRHTTTNTTTTATINNNNSNQFYLTPDMVSIPLDTAAEEMKRECMTTIIDPRELFNDWVDQNILYIHNPNIHSPRTFGYNSCSIQLARPVDATVYYTNENKQ